MKAFEITAMHEILNQTQNIFVEMDTVEQLLEEIPLDSMNWFLMSAFVNDLTQANGKASGSQNGSKTSSLHSKYP